MWISKDGTKSIIIATSKAKDNLFVYNAEDLKFIKTIGKKGTGQLEFDRPNGIWVIDDMLLVVERDNHRVQILSLPDFKFIGFVGEKELGKPYGLSIYNKKGVYQLYVTDAFEVEGEIYPPQNRLNERVKHYTFEIKNNMINSKLVKTFGETKGEGVLWIVESIFADTTYNRIIIAEEDKNQNLYKIYDLDGKFQNLCLGDDLIEYQAEGVMLYDKGNGEGYYFLTDQDYYNLNNNAFHIFNRKDMKYLGSFISNNIQNTDGIWVTNQKFGKFDKGALIAVNNDGGVGIIDMKIIIKTLELK